MKSAVRPLVSLAVLVACAQGDFEEDGTGTGSQTTGADAGRTPTKPSSSSGSSGNVGSSSSSSSGSGASSSSSGSSGSSSSSSGSSGTSSSSSGSSGTSSGGVDAGTGTRCVGLLINEVQTAGATPQAEFVELYNPGPTCMTTGWKLVYRSATGTTDVNLFDVAVTIPQQGYAVLAGSDFVGAKAGSLSASMAGTSGQLQLRDPSAQVSDSLGYGVTTGSFVRVAPAMPPPASQSIARSPNGVTTMNNFVDFQVATTPSPGAANP